MYGYVRSIPCRQDIFKKNLFKTPGKMLKKEPLLFKLIFCETVANGCYFSSGLQCQHTSITEFEKQKKEKGVFKMNKYKLKR